MILNIVGNVLTLWQPAERIGLDNYGTQRHGSPIGSVFIETDHSNDSDSAQSSADSLSPEDTTPHPVKLPNKKYQNKTRDRVYGWKPENFITFPWIEYNADKQQATCTYRRCKMYVTFLLQLSVVRGHILIWRHGCLFSMREAQSTEANACESSSKSRNGYNFQLLNSMTTPFGLAYTALGG